MKKSQLQSIIREEVKSALGEAQSNPELDRTISQFVAGLAKKYDYQQSDAVMAIFEAMKRLGLINKNTNYMAADGLSEGAYESATRNELAMYLTLLYTTLGEEEKDGNMAMVKFLTMDIEEVKAALKAKGGNVDSLKEYTSNPFKAIVPGSGRPAIDPAFFAKLMPKSARTSKEAYARIQQWNGKSMSVYSQYFEVTPNGNMPNRPIYQLHQQQYGGGSNVTFLTILDVTDGGRGKDVGVCYVDTKVFLQEYKVVFQLIKQVS